MKKIIYIIFTYLFIFPGVNYAQYSATMGLDSASIIAQLEGQGVKVLNPKVYCRDSTYGIFRGVGDLGMDSGIVLCTDKIEDLFAPYNHALYGRQYICVMCDPDYNNKFDTTYFKKESKDWYGGEVAPLKFEGSCGIEFDVVPVNDKILIDYIFIDNFLDSIPIKISPTYDFPNFSANHKSPCLCLPNVNPLGIFVTGGSYGLDTINYAVFPQDDVIFPNAPVNRYTLQYNPEYFSITCPELDASYMLWGGYARDYFLRYNTAGYRFPDINTPGLTIPMTAVIPTTPCDTLHIAIGTSYNYLNPISCRTKALNTSAVLVSKISSPGMDTACAAESRAGIVSPAQLGVQLHPNPFQSQLQFTSRHPSRIYELQVTDMLGRLQLHISGDAASIQTQLSAQTVSALSADQLYFWRIYDTYTQQATVIKLRKD